MIRKSVGKFFLVAALALSPATVLRAQDTAASLTGVVTDATGAAVPGATVELLNPATGQTYKTTTNGVGSYTLTNITPGPGYKETVSRDGFQTAVLTGVYMNISATRTQNVNLATGVVSQTVSVSASGEGETLNTTDATIGNNF